MKKLAKDSPVLLLHDRPEPFGSLRSALAGISVESVPTHTCSEARALLQGASTPRLVFTDVQLSDGTWKEVVAAAAAAEAPVGVIVVNRFPDDLLYVQAMCCGAADFIAPPFTPRDLAHVVASALQSVFERTTVKPLGFATAAAQ